MAYLWRSGLIVVGGLTLINSLFGCVGSCYKRSMLTIYLIIGTVLTLAQVRLADDQMSNECVPARQ